MENLMRRQVTEALAGAQVEPVLDQADLRPGDGGEIAGLGQVLADQPIGVLVGAALPSRVGIGKVKVGIETGADALMRGELTAVVSGERLDPVGDWSQAPTGAVV